MKKVVVSLVISLAVTACLIAGLIHLWVTAPAPQTVDIAEAAIAVDGTVALGHLDSKKIGALLQQVNEGLTGQPLPLIPDNIPELQLLLTGQIAHQSQLEHLVWALALPTQGNDTSNPKAKKANMSIVALGRFSPSDIEHAFEQNFTLERKSDNSLIATEKEKIDEYSDTPVCEKGPQKAASTPTQLYLDISATTLFIANNEEQLITIRQRFDQQSASQIDLSNWKEFRRGRLASFGILTPANAQKSASGITRMLLAKNKSDIENLHSAYFALDINYLKRGLKLSSLISADSNTIKSWGEKTISSIQEIKQKSEEFSPTVGQLLDGLNASASKEQLNIKFSINPHQIEKLGDAFQEILFGGFSSKPSNSGTLDSEVTEEINDTPFDFSQYNKTPTTLPFKTQNDNPPAVHEGAFALMFKGFSLDLATGLSSLNIEGAVQTQKLEGFDSSRQFSLRVLDIVNAHGQSILRDERCMDLQEISRFGGANHTVSTGGGIGHEGQLTGSKQMVLAEGFHFEAVDKIIAELTLKAPTDIFSVKTDAKAGVIYDKDGIHITISSVASGSISLNTKKSDEFDMKNIVEIRALNAAGQVLKNTNSFSSSTTKQQSFSGTAASFEFYIARKFTEEQQRIEASKTKLYAAFQPSEMTRPSATSFQATQLSQWHEFSTINLAERPEKDWNLWNFDTQDAIATREKSTHLLLKVVPQWNNEHILQAEFYYPMVDGFVSSPNGATINIEEINHQTANHSQPINLLSWVSTLNDVPTHAFEFNDKPFIKLSQNMALKNETSIEHLKGDITLTFNNSANQNTYPFSLDPYSQSGLPEELVFSGIKKEWRDSSVHFIFKGDPAQLAFSALRDKQGKIYPAQDYIYHTHGITILFPFINDIDAVELFLADKTEMLKIPFEYNRTKDTTQP